MLRSTVKVATCVVVALGAYLLLWPIPIEPVAWDPPKAPEFSGPYALNDALARGRRLLEGIGTGPEDVAFDAEGRLYTGFANGRVVRTSLPDGRPEVFAETGGRPLGMVFDAAGNLLVADAVKGLLSISTEGRTSLFASGVVGRPFGFPNDLDVGPDGTVYFTDSSSKFGIGSDVPDLVQHGGHGRLLAWSPADRSVRVLLEGLQFANGVVVEPTGAFVLVAETGAYRITRYWLIGERAGTSEAFAQNLPGFPDNISRTPDGRIWVSLPSPRLPIVDSLGPHPFLRKVLLRLPASLQPGPLRHGLVVELAPDGRAIRALHDPSGGVALVSSVMEREGSLYLGSYLEPSLVVVPLP
jgi:sugar lactone lactonase YvrE